MRQEERSGGAWPLNLDSYLASDRSAEALWSTALRSPALASLPEMRVSASTTAKMVNAPCLRATSRASFAVYNTKDEIDILAESIQKVIKLFHG